MLYTYTEILTSAHPKLLPAHSGGLAVCNALQVGCHQCSPIEVVPTQTTLEPISLELHFANGFLVNGRPKRINESWRGGRNAQKCFHYFSDGLLLDKN